MLKVNLSQGNDDTGSISAVTQFCVSVFIPLPLVDHISVSPARAFSHLILPTALCGS